MRRDITIPVRVVEAALQGAIPMGALAVYSVLAYHGRALSYDEIAAPFGGSKVRVFRHLMSLVNAGFVKRDSSGDSYAARS